MSGGDTLFIRGGTYAEIFDIFGPSGSSGSPTLIQNYPSEVPVFNENDITSGAPTINGVSWMTLSGLTIKSNNIALVVGYAGACNNVILTNLTVTSIGQQGIQFENNSYNCQLLNSTIHDTGLWIYNGEGVYIGQGDSVGVTDNSHDILVKGCTIYNTGDEGIEMKGGTYNISAISNILYSDNLPQNPYGASGGAIEVDEEGVNNFWPINPNQIVTGNLVYNTFTGIRGGTGCKIINNVVYNCTNYGIYLNHFSGQSVNPTYTRYAYNNTVDEPTAKGVVVSGVTNSIINNIGSTNTYNLAVSGTYFSNYGGHDYHLLVGSAPIGAGANLSSVVPADFDGVSRPSTNLFDIGAYQYVSPPTSVGAPSPFLFLMQ
jgi:hypothetical protein